MCCRWDVSEVNEPVLVGLNVPGTPASWEALGFALRGGKFRVGGVTITVGQALTAWSFDHPRSAPDQIASVPTTSFCEAGPGAAVAVHPNRVGKIDHVVVASNDPSATKAELESAGFRAKGERVIGAAQAPKSQCFFWSGELLIELVGPADAGSARQSSAYIWGVTFVVDDFGPLTRIAGALLSDSRAAIQPGRRIITVSAAAQIGLELAFMTPHVRRSLG